MSIASKGDRIPALTLGWRLRMALGEAGIKAEEMAGQLGVSRQTLSRWMGDKGEPPKRAYVAQWALITGVPLEWIQSGTIPTSPEPPDDGARGSQVDALARLTAKKRGRHADSAPTRRYANAA